ncbi:MAG: septum formation initiator family protein [Actinomycetota bacterium]|nr:septum formation initiator family protein [Actinomycetota bacterium]
MSTTMDTPAVAPARRGRRGSFVAVLLLVGLAIVLAGVFPFRQLIAQERLVDNTRAKLDALIVENAAIQGQIDAAQSPTELERIAREQYGMVRPGETSYIVELDGGPVPQEVVDQQQMLDSRSLLQRFWDFLTGRDLVPDE